VPGGCKPYRAGGVPILISYLMAYNHGIISSCPTSPLAVCELLGTNQEEKDSRMPGNRANHVHLARDLQVRDQDEQNFHEKRLYFLWIRLVCFCKIIFFLPSKNGTKMRGEKKNSLEITSP